MSVAASPYEQESPAAGTESPRKPAGASHPEAEDRPATLFGGDTDYAFGGFGGLGVMYTRFAGMDAVSVCGEGAVIIDHALTLGGGGCGVTRLAKAQNFGDAIYDSDQRMAFGYGGAIGRYHFFSRKVVNLSVGTLIGAGALTVGTRKPDADRGDMSLEDTRDDAVFVLEPQVGGYANLTRWLRVGASVGYRFVAGVDFAGVKSSDLAGPSAGLQIQAGWF